MEEYFANIGIPLDFFAASMLFVVVERTLGFGAFTNKPSVPSGGISRGRVCGYGCRCW